jgi:hypothetical protein
VLTLSCYVAAAVVGCAERFIHRKLLTFTNTHTPAKAFKLVILGSRNNNSYYYYYISFFRAYLVTILKALEVCCVLVKPSKRIVKFKQLRESVRKRRRKKGIQWPCRLQEGSVFTAKLEI